MCIAPWESYEKRRKYDCPVHMGGTEEALPMLCELLNNLQDETERAEHRPGFFLPHRQIHSKAG